MEKKRIAIANFYPGFDPSSRLTFRLASKHFNIEFVEENPDFVIASVFGHPSNVLKYECPRIQFLGEPQSPDFSLFDYAVGSDFLTILDFEGHNRYFRFPIAFWNWNADYALAVQTPLTREEATSRLAKKDLFCDFIYSHESVGNMRENVMRALANYKRVECAGTMFNNMEGGVVVHYENRSKDKLSLVERCKFSIVGESMAFPGFVTEKIVHAFFAASIPIYIGDPLVGLTFNPKAFINVNDFESLDAMVDYVEKLDNDDDLYLDVLCQDKFLSREYFPTLVEQYEQFIVHVLSQPPEKRYRRQRYFAARNYEMMLLHQSGQTQSPFSRLLSRLKHK